MRRQPHITSALYSSLFCPSMARKLLPCLLTPPGLCLSVKRLVFPSLRQTKAYLSFRWPFACFWAVFGKSAQKRSPCVKKSQLISMRCALLPFPDEHGWGMPSAYMERPKKEKEDQDARKRFAVFRLFLPKQAGNRRCGLGQVQ